MTSHRDPASLFRYEERPKLNFDFDSNPYTSASVAKGATKAGTNASSFENSNSNNLNSKKTPALARSISPPQSPLYSPYATSPVSPVKPRVTGLMSAEPDMPGYFPDCSWLFCRKKQSPCLQTPVFFTVWLVSNEIYLDLTGA